MNKDPIQARLSTVVDTVEQSLLARRQVNNRENVFRIMAKKPLKMNGGTLGQQPL